MIRKVKEFKINDRIYIFEREYRIRAFPTRQRALLESGFKGSSTPWAEKKILNLTILNMRRWVESGKLQFWPPKTE